jgi:HEAT repeat protein
VLHSLFDGMDPATRVPATVALAQLGDAPALARIDQMLASNVPQVQIAAAEAWSGRPGPWTEIIRALLDNPDGFTRLDAAKAIAPVDPEAAKRTLNAALDDPNPVIRYQSATSIEDLSEGNPAVLDVASLRKRLRDADPMVRLVVASTLLKLARS